LVANLLYQRACLQIAKCIRATSAQELTSIRQAGFRNPVALVPNGVELPHLPPRPNPEPTIAKRRRVLFLSRIHPKKGLLNLVEAWSTLRPRHWELLIVGPDEVGHLAEVQRAVASHALQDSVSFGSPVWGESRNAVYQSADLFVLPSFSENFGLVIAEALANGLPVITTHATPWRELSEHHCGWWSDVGIAPLIESLKEAFAMSAAELRQMGNRGRQLIESRYAWEPLGSQMAAVYEWMLGGPRPDYIIDD
jgi:glycosyltransferase involved in cell wall biosynthesis